LFALSRIVGDFGTLKSPQNPPPDRKGVLNKFQAGRIGCP
jgi:hypothetical protein